MSAIRTDLTQLLQRWRQGDAAAEASLVDAVYPILRKIASRQMSNRDRAAFAATELVNEAFLRLLDSREIEFANRGHFFAIAARIIRRVLIDQVRSRSAEKRGADWLQVSMGNMLIQGAAADFDGEELLALDQALTQLERVRERAAKLIELRYFGGLSIEEASVECEVSIATAKRDCQFAIAFLHERLGRSI